MFETIMVGLFSFLFPFTIALGTVISVVFLVWMIQDEFRDDPYSLWNLLKERRKTKTK